jgi:uncharacterized protein (DUF983 family)
MTKKPNDVWLWMILLVAVPVVGLSFFVGGWLLDMSLWDRAKIIVPITIIVIWFSLRKK